MATGYNLNHLQVAPKGPTPTFVDVPMATTAEFGIDQDNDTFRADGRVAATAYGAREGTGSIAFGSANLSAIAAMTGDDYSTSGTPGTSAIDRLEIGGATVPPPLILVAWVPNVDGNVDWVGMRVTVTNGSLSVPSSSFEQESWTEFESDLSFSDNEDGVMLIWETMEATPTFTGGVIPVQLEAPAP